MPESSIQLNARAVRTKSEKGTNYIWCQIRKKWILWSPEEIVRQSLLNYMVEEADYWPSHIAVEKQISAGHTRRRFDICVADRAMNTQLLVECKAPQVQISDASVQQLLGYNLHLRARYLVLSNGHSTWIYDSLKSSWREDFPSLHLDS